MDRDVLRGVFGCKKFLQSCAYRGAKRDSGKGLMMAVAEARVHII